MEALVSGVVCARHWHEHGLRVMFLLHFYRTLVMFAPMSSGGKIKNSYHTRMVMFWEPKWYCFVVLLPTSILFILSLN